MVRYAQVMILACFSMFWYVAATSQECDNPDKLEDGDASGDVLLLQRASGLMRPPPIKMDGVGRVTPAPPKVETITITRPPPPIAVPIPDKIPQRPPIVADGVGRMTPAPPKVETITITRPPPPIAVPIP